VPDRTKNKLRNVYLHTLRNNILQAEEIVRLSGLLRRNHIEAIPLKGAVASDLIFGDRGLYLSGDIDVLVRPSDIPDVSRVLTEAGYKKYGAVSENDLFSSHYHLIFQKDGHRVEVHWNLVKRYFQIPPDFWWGDVRKTEFEGMEISALSGERYIMYTVFRLFDHGFRPLKFFVIISELINRYQADIDWHMLLILSKRYKMERLMIFVLKLLRDVLMTDIPDDVTRKNVAGYGILKKVIVSGLLNSVKRPHLRMFCFTFLLDTPMNFAKIISRRVFPCPGEIRLRYGLNKTSRKIYAYYILNPFLVLRKRL
jgi:hypothetical protein